MIGRIRGELVEKNFPQVIVSCAGVGYEIDVPMSTFYPLPRAGEEVTLLTHLVAQQTDLQVGDFVWTGGDCHLYLNHLEQVETQLARTPLPLLRRGRGCRAVPSRRPAIASMVAVSATPRGLMWLWIEYPSSAITNICASLALSITLRRCGGSASRIIPPIRSSIQLSSAGL